MAEWCALAWIAWMCVHVVQASQVDKRFIFRSTAGVEVQGRLVTGSRYKRAVNKDMVGFNEEEKRTLLARHNYLRSTEGASDMMAMKWDEKLEKSAQVYSEKCIFEHSKNRENLAGYRYVGENLYAGTGEFDPPNVIQLFYDEKYNYSYDTGQCFISMCGHYTQVVWSSSSFLGCGVKYCPVLQGASTFDHGYNVVCHYGPGGNIQGRKPFTKGDKCTKCPAETKYCHKGMCVVRPQIGVSTHIHSTTYTLTLGVALLAVLCIL